MPKAKKAIKGRVVVIGSGFGGLAAAIRLQARGHETIPVEMRDKPGGQAYVYEQDGFTFDAGPTMISAPFLFEELAAVAGKRLTDYVKMMPCDPFFRILFPDGRSFNYTGDSAEMEAEVARFNPEDVEGYRELLKHSETACECFFSDYGARSCHSVWRMLKATPDLLRLKAGQSLYERVAAHIQDPSLRQVFSFRPLFSTGNPLIASSVQSMWHHLEWSSGVCYVMGGTGALVNALVRIFKELGGSLRLNTRVDEILIRDDGVAMGVKTAAGEEIRSWRVVSNGDVAGTYRNLVKEEYRGKWTDKALRKMRYSNALFVLCLGAGRVYPHLAHHTIVMGERYKELLVDICERKSVPDDFLLHVHAPARKDPLLAPPGHEGIRIISPVPHLGGEQDWDAIKEEYAERILASLEKEHLLPSIRKHLVTKRIFTPKDFETRMGATMGAAFQFEPLAMQSAWFRPHNRSEDVDGLYFVGAGTHPGAGLPGVLCSAKVLEEFF